MLYAILIIVNKSHSQSEVHAITFNLDLVKVQGLYRAWKVVEF